MLKSAAIVIAWMVGGTIVAIMIGYVPGALDLVDDERWGRMLGKFLLPTVLLFALAGAAFAKGKRGWALGIAGFVLLGYVALDVFVIATALSS
jgi:hypothetical protein